MSSQRVSFMLQCGRSSPRSSTDRAAAFEAVDGGSIPSGDTAKQWTRANAIEAFA
jgi:hypothetical protein